MRIIHGQYCAKYWTEFTDRVLHALGIRGIDGEYGPNKNAAAINFGSVGQGAVRALRALGFSDITVYVQHDPSSLKNVPSGVEA